MTSKDSKESYKCTGKKIVPSVHNNLQALQNNNPLLLSTNVCFWYSKCLFFADVLVDILGFRFRLIFSMHLIFNNFYERKATFQFKIILVAAM